MKLITRSDYMADSKNLHRTYYAQFVTPTIKNMVLNKFGAEKLKAALKQNKNLNSIPLKEWDLLIGYYGNSITLPLPQSRIKETGEGLSASTAICTVKEAARQIVEESQE